MNENEAQILTSRIKRRVEDHSEERLAQMLRTKVQNVEPEVLSQMPEQTALVRRIQRARRRNMPANPTTLDDLHDVQKKSNTATQSTDHAYTADVARAFTALRTSCSAALHPVYNFFRKNYVTGTPA